MIYNDILSGSLSRLIITNLTDQSVRHSVRFTQSIIINHDKSQYE